MPDPEHLSPACGRPTPRAASTCSIGRSGRNSGSPPDHSARPNPQSSGPTAEHPRRGIAPAFLFWAASRSTPVCAATEYPSSPMTPQCDHRNTFLLDPTCSRLLAIATATAVLISGLNGLVQILKV